MGSHLTLSSVSAKIGRFAVSRSCLRCGAVQELSLCERCLSTLYLDTAQREKVSLVHTPEGRCVKCGRILVSCDGLCLSCRTLDHLSGLDRALSLYPYCGFSAVIMAAWKKSQDRSIAWLFARLLADPLRELYAHEGMDWAIVPVPPRPGKVGKTGWDQIDDLTRELRSRFSFPVARCLTRNSAIEQKGLGKEARAHNARGTMKAVSGFRVPSSACVIDDVMTTGSTIDSCAYALKEAGCRTVHALTLFFD